MHLLELLLIAIGLSMDAFAVAITIGLSTQKSIFRKALVVGLYFGIFQAAMPLIGFLIGTQFADMIIAYDHWIAFVLLCIIGGKMIYESLRKEGCKDRRCPDGTCEDRTCPGGKKPENREISPKPAVMLPFAIATSIDALAVGVSFAFLQVDIVPAVSIIGITTLLLSAAGVKIGNIFGGRFKARAEFVGGVILVLIGLKIVLEHMG